MQRWSKVHASDARLRCSAASYHRLDGMCSLGDARTPPARPATAKAIAARRVRRKTSGGSVVPMASNVELGFGSEVNAVPYRGNSSPGASVVCFTAGRTGNADRAQRAAAGLDD